jgi:hypothetical protein
VSKIAVFEVQGGIGKHVAFTAVLKAFKKQKPEYKTVVVSAWPEIFLGNPNCDRVYKIGNTPYFYEDFIKGRDDTLIFAQEPYRETSHILKKSRLAETWCKMIDIEYAGELPEIFLNSPELESGKISNNDKPNLIFQPFGGPGKDHQSLQYSWMRDIYPPFAQEMVNVLSHKFNVIHICYDFHPVLQNCQRFDRIIPKKVLFAMMVSSEKRLLIDSSLQHAAAGLGLASSVVWIGTQPEVFGYDLHTNYKPTKSIGGGNVDSYLYDYNFNGEPYECPFNDPSQLLDYNQIISDIMS